MQKLLYYPFIVFITFLAITNYASASNFNQVILLNPGWNIVSTPRILDSYSFSAPETSDNFDIYALDSSKVSGWSTMADFGQTKFEPLYGYFVNNKTGSNQNLTLNYKDSATPNERLFERNFSKTGWYSIGPAQPTYTKTKCADITDSNNVASILYPLSGKYSAIVDFTDSVFTTNPNSVAVGSSWKSVIPADANSINDFRELKGYAIYINQENALYSGFQNNTEPVACFALGNAIINPGFASSSYVIGSSNAKIASFKIENNFASSTESLKITGLSFDKDNNPNFDINNLKVKVGANQFGATQTTITDTGTAIQFTDNTNPLIINAGNYAIVDVYADIATSSVAGDYISPIDLTDWTANGFISNNIVNFSGVVDGQDIRLEASDVITITFNGPIAGEIFVRAQSVPLFNFTIASKNNIEIRNLRFGASTTGAIAIYNNFEVWDKTTNQVITSAATITSASSTTVSPFTDIVTVAAGQTRSFSVTADVDSTDTAAGTVYVSLLPFQSNDIKNTDNNTFVSTSNIVPSTVITGNTMTVKAASLDVQLSSTPSSQTYVQGSSNVALVGFSFRAVSGTVKISQIIITGSSTVGTLTTGEVQSLGLYDGNTLVSSIKSLSSNLTLTFDNLNYTINAGDTKVLTLKGNISPNADNGDKYYFYIAAANANNVVVYDPDGNSASFASTASAANSGATVVATITTTGTVAVVTAPDDTDSQAGIVLAGTESVLGKFRFTATNEDMTINKMQILVASTSVATGYDTTVGANVPTIKLYDGTTQLGATSGYTVTGSGSNAGTVFITNLGWVIPKNSSKTLTIKGVVNTISNGAKSGASVFVSVMAAGFEAQGSTGKTTSLTAAKSNQKVVYKTKPTIGDPVAASSKLTSSEMPVIRFTLKSDGPEQIGWQQIQFKISMTGATMSAVDAVPGTNSATVILRDVDTATNINIANAFSSTSTSTGEQVKITGGSTGYVSLYLNSEQNIAAGSTKTYELQLTFANVPNSVTANAAVTASINLVSSSVLGGVTQAAVIAQDAHAFLWSDYSSVSHNTGTSDWANGLFVKDLPTTQISISN